MLPQRRFCYQSLILLPYLISQIGETGLKSNEERVDIGHDRYCCRQKLVRCRRSLFDNEVCEMETKFLEQLLESKRSFLGDLINRRSTHIHSNFRHSKTGLHSRKPTTPQVSLLDQKAISPCFGIYSSFGKRSFSIEQQPEGYNSFPVDKIEGVGSMLNFIIRIE